MVLYQLKMLHISKSTGPDDINARMLKELAVVISKPLSMLFNNSLKTGTVPSEWKMAPIHKKKNYIKYPPHQWPRHYRLKRNNRL